MLVGAGVLKSEYMSAEGSEIKDSAGEFSNLTCGVEAGVCSDQELIIVCGGLTSRRTWVVVVCVANLLQQKVQAKERVIRESNLLSLCSNRLVE